MKKKVLTNIIVGVTGTLILGASIGTYMLFAPKDALNPAEFFNPEGNGMINTNHVQQTQTKSSFASTIPTNNTVNNTNQIPPTIVPTANTKTNSGSNIGGASGGGGAGNTTGGSGGSGAGGGAPNKPDTVLPNVPITPDGPNYQSSSSQYHEGPSGIIIPTAVPYHSPTPLPSPTLYPTPVDTGPGVTPEPGPEQGTFG